MMLIRNIVALFTFYLSFKSAFSLDTPESKGEAKTDVQANVKTSTVQYDSSSITNISNKSDKVISIPLVGKLPKGNGDIHGMLPNKVTPGFVLEGGDVVDQISTTSSNKDGLEIATIDADVNHSKGSKGRKGVQYPGSSVVPRKGVDAQGVFHSNYSSISEESLNGLLAKDTVSNVSNNKLVFNHFGQLNTHSDQNELHVNTIPKTTHAKKPEVVSDVGDVDDFDKYSIIKTSTTGEDYIIIGIVIVLGIWCSVFGALIFYRRAGEYWDRRHYRRMDFLVEGMYND